MKMEKTNKPKKKKNNQRITRGTKRELYWVMEAEGANKHG